MSKRDVEEVEKSLEMSKIDAGSALNLDLVKMFVVLKVGNSSLL